MKTLKGMGKFILGLIAGAALITGVANVVVCQTSAPCMASAKEAAAFQADCVLVLGAAVDANGDPTPILRDRLDVGASLYQAGAASKIIVTGNNSAESHHEADAMKSYLVGKGVPAADIMCDNYGRTTYDSMWRARNVFEVARVIVVTQTYHEHRSLFDAKGAGMEACGVPSDLSTYAFQNYYDFREIFARVKDLGLVLLHVPANTQRA